MKARSLQTILTVGVVLTATCIASKDAEAGALAAAGRETHALKFAAPAVELVQVADKAAKSYKIGSLVIEAPWARATPGGAKVAGGYLKITNTGQTADRLVGGSLAVAATVEVHEMAMSDNVMKMRRLHQGLEIKPGQTVELKPGGYHLMFMELREGLKQGQTVKGTLVFEKAGTVEVEYRVAPIGAQSGGGHMKH
ncbi:MAG: copper chaperone PCu(A)C [Hyphomicrobiaceae bacterium]|nr:MAG: copper chaperone PCu(A)C [Hyphomicrobiaceae bacterium]